MYCFLQPSRRDRILVFLCVCDDQSTMVKGIPPQTTQYPSIRHMEHTCTLRIHFSYLLSSVENSSSIIFSSVVTIYAEASIAPYLKHKIKSYESDTCWWCEKDVRQTREHLFKECSHWKDDIRILWQQVERDVRPRWKRFKWKPISALFNEKKTTEAILNFLDRTGVGKKPRDRGLEEFDGEEPEM